MGGIRYSEITKRPPPGRQRAAGLPRLRHPGLIHQPYKAVLDDGVAAAVLGGVERGIGGFDQIAGALGVAGQRAGDADETVTALWLEVACGISRPWTVARTDSPTSMARSAPV